MNHSFKLLKTSYIKLEKYLNRAYPGSPWTPLGPGKPGNPSSPCLPAIPGLPGTVNPANISIKLRKLWFIL